MCGHGWAGLCFVGRMQHPARLPAAQPKASTEQRRRAAGPVGMAYYASALGKGPARLPWWSLPAFASSPSPVLTLPYPILRAQLAGESRAAADLLALSVVINQVGCVTQGLAHGCKW